MKCHAGVEFPSGKPCPKCNAQLGELCWPGINADLLELARLRAEFEIVRTASRLFEDAANTWMERALKAEAAIATLTPADGCGK